ncbi:MAG TPA: hypothetical protein VEK77_02100 [Gemmatimonadales bacterium]|nr:hypothetical protein [Gemmatimonadales bacterium]
MAPDGLPDPLRVALAAVAGGATLRVDTAEHTVLRKLEWFQRGRRGGGAARHPSDNGGTWSAYSGRRGSASIGKS